MDQQLVFIYNAKSGFMHGVMDIIHKSASPATYPCKLCQMTYSGATMNKLWKYYISSLSIHSIFMYRDEFEKTYPNQSIKYPAVLLKTGASFRTILNAEDFSKLKDLGELMKLLNERLSRAQRK